MVVLQAILTLITRFLGKFFSTLFGWAVNALFGQQAKQEQTLYSVIVGAAAAWPLLVLGTIAPRVATFLLAFVPLSKKLDAGFIRGVWILLALAVPIALGVVFARRAPPASPPEPRVKRLLRGFPLTIGIAGAFLVVLVVTPIRKVRATVRGLKEEHVPLVMDKDAYWDVAALIRRALDAHGFELHETEPGIGKRLPSTILRALGGNAFRGSIPERLACFASPAINLVVNPNGVTLTGDEKVTARAHGLLSEALARTDVYQTTDADAQSVEKEIREVWKVYDENPAAHAGSRALNSRVADIAQEIVDLSVSYDDWQVLYREALQLSRALRGERQLLSKNAPQEVPMPEERDPYAPDPRAKSAATMESLPLSELLGSITEKAKLLVQKEVELAKTEIKQDVRSEIGMVKGLAVGGVALLLGIQMLLVSLAFVLSEVMPAWLAALVVAAPFLAIGGVSAGVAWKKRITHPLEATRASVKESVEWAKNRLA